MSAIVTYPTTDNLHADTSKITLDKILQALNGGAGGSGGGGTGTTEVYFGVGDPNGAQTATRPAIFYSADGAVWHKMNAGNNNTGWVQIIAP